MEVWEYGSVEVTMCCNNLTNYLKLLNNHTIHYIPYFHTSTLFKVYLHRLVKQVMLEDFGQ